MIWFINMRNWLGLVDRALKTLTHRPVTIPLHTLFNFTFPSRRPLILSCLRRHFLPLLAKGRRGNCPTAPPCSGIPGLKSIYLSCHCLFTVIKMLQTQIRHVICVLTSPRTRSTCTPYLEVLRPLSCCSFACTVKLMFSASTEHRIV